MANDRPGGDWRHSGGRSPAPAPHAKTSRRAWQPGGAPGPSTPGKARSRGGRLLTAGLVTGALAGLVVLLIWFFWPARYPQLVLVGGTGTESLALPENAAGATAAAELSGWAGESHNRDRPRIDAEPAVTVDAAGPRIAIDAAAKNLVIVFSAHGGADAEGAYLWMAPPQARSASEAHKVRVRDIIDRVGEARRGKPTLLVFDATRVTISWPHGLLLNDFTRALKELDSRIEAIPGLAVISASDDDQRSWLFEERGVSVFSHYFLQAMKGAGHDRGQRVTAATALAHAKAEVERWSIANRAEKQSPILLPQGSGQARAEKIDLAAAPAAGYQNPSTLVIPASVPPDLVDAWKTANELARQVPAPEADEPGKWHEYLDLLLRQERLFRLGANTTTIRDRVSALAAQIQNPTVGREPACLAAALPTARALGRPPLFPETAKKEAAQFRDEFDGLWRPLDKSVSRPDIWAAILRRHPGRETQARVAGAELAVLRLIDDGPTKENLATADAVLAAIFAGDGHTIPAEAHLARMLHHHLPAESPARPEQALVKEALLLRREAEEAAWVFMAKPGEYPYSEAVFPWVKTRIEAGDRSRQLGEDLLFGGDPRMWTALQSHFAKAREEYAAARAEGSKVAAALATRDRVLARLPYYARWLANYRGTRPQTDVEELVGRAESAFRDAHHITDLLDKETPSAERLAQLDKLRAQTDAHLKTMTDAFDADIARLTNEPLPSNWHALDNALTVPFIPAQRRAELLGFLRHVSYQLETNRQQLDGSQVPPPRMREIAVRSGRLAIALLGDTASDRPQLTTGADELTLRDVGNRVGERFRTLAKEARDHGDASVRARSLSEGTAVLAKSALRGRLADPAAPLANPDPVAALERQRRHSFLLWQAQRTRTEGWANVGSTSTRTRPANIDDWYCRKSALNLIATAESLIRENAAELTGRPIENLAPGELDRWLGDCRQESALKPVVLTLNAPPVRDVADEPDWTFAFSMTTAEKAAVGYPVSWLSAPPRPYPQAEPAALARHVEADFPDGRLPASRRILFKSTPGTRQKQDSGKLLTALFYRGHIYENTTEVVLLGAPTREVVYTPPQGQSAFGIRTDRGAVAGTVAILIDLSTSMNEHLGDKETSTRLEEAKKGLRQVLRQLPPGTTVTLAPFHGDRGRTALTAEPFGPPRLMDGTNWERVYDTFKDTRAAGGSTPIAGAIAKVLSKEHQREFWTAAGTGARTLIVLTDGVDNWGRIENGPSVYPEQKEPGPVALEALLGTPDDVSLHIVFFGMTSESDRKAQMVGKSQFEILSRSEHFLQLKRTPAQLWTGINDATALAEVCRNAMLPRFQYARGDERPDRIEASIAGDSGMRVTPPLDPGVYKIRGLSKPQAVELFPGDRILLEGRRLDGKFELFRPPYAHETASRRDLPRETNGTASTGGIHATIPEIRLENLSNHADLSLAVTLEPIGERDDPNLLAVSRPRFTWFDVRYADGTPFDKGAAPTIAVRNRWPLWAPGWDLKLRRWDRAGVDHASAKLPVIDAYWLDGFPVSQVNYPVDVTDLPGSFDRLEKFHTARVGEHDVTLISLSREEFSGPGLPKGEYLTVRMKYGKPGEFVYLRPGNLKGTDQPFALYEHHAYFDDHSRYTARFGPIFDSDSNKTVTLQLHPVAALREASRKASRSVQLRLPPGKLPSHEMPTELRLEPRKK